MPAVLESKALRRKNAERAATKLISAHMRDMVPDMVRKLVERPNPEATELMNRFAPWFGRFSNAVRDELMGKGLDFPERLILAAPSKLDKLGLSDKARAEINEYRARFREPVKVMGVSI